MTEAKLLQNEMASQVITEDHFNQNNSFIGGMDVSNLRFDPEKMIHASCVVLSYPNLAIADEAKTSQKITFPYIPGFLGFREAPALVKAFEQLTIQPDIIFVDGHGQSHPRGLGIASHVGVLLDVPTIGVAKSILIGKPEGKLGEEAGSIVS